VKNNDGHAMTMVRESLDSWKARILNAPERESLIPVTLLKIVHEWVGHVSWNLNYNAFKKACSEVKRKIYIKNNLDPHAEG
jgi:hypothetical protein